MLRVDYSKGELKYVPTRIGSYSTLSKARRNDLRCSFRGFIGRWQPIIIAAHHYVITGY
jgi:hypothetical protein